MTLPAILKSKKTIILLSFIVMILVIGLLAYRAELRKESLVENTPPSVEDIKRMSDEAWERYKKEQAEQEKQGIVNQTDNIPDQSVTIRDYFLEALRESLPIGADKSAAIELFAVDDACLKFNETASNDTLLVYECVMSPRYPQGTIRRITLDENGKILDYYIDNNPGIHSGVPYTATAP